jgi:hypothetical protein
MKTKQDQDFDIWDDLEITYKFSWKGSNIENMDAGNRYISISFSGYDKKLNPFQGFTVSTTFNPFNLSKNNPAKITYNIAGEVGSINYTYTYSGNVPDKITTTISGDILPVIQGSILDDGVKYYEYYE